MRIRMLVFPMVFALAVVVLPATLVAVGARSPYTHANLRPEYDPGYVRTAQTEVGAPLLFRGQTLAVQPAANAPLEQRGKALLAARGCAGCHGVDGEGGVVAPAIIPDLEIVRENVRRGPRGMPVYSPAELTDYDLTAIVAYLKATQK